ncbi:MAG: hypothetical protein EOO65_04850, partial [Methanosarcinales archaeon]
NQPKRVENAKIMVANTSMDTDKVKIFGSRVRVDSMAKVAEIEAAEKMKMKDKVSKIVSHGINCFINRQLIYNYPEQLFAESGVMAIEHADFDGIERLAAVTGGEVASTFEHPELVALGECKLIEEILIGEDSMIRFSGVKAGEACTYVPCTAHCTCVPASCTFISSHAMRMRRLTAELCCAAPLRTCWRRLSALCTTRCAC